MTKLYYAQKASPLPFVSTKELAFVNKKNSLCWTPTPQRIRIHGKGFYHPCAISSGTNCCRSHSCCNFSDWHRWYWGRSIPSMLFSTSDTRFRKGPAQGRHHRCRPFLIDFLPVICLPDKFTYASSFNAFGNLKKYNQQDLQDDPKKEK